MHQPRRKCRTRARRRVASDSSYCEILLNYQEYLDGILPEHFLLQLKFSEKPAQQAERATCRKRAGSAHGVSSGVPAVYTWLVPASAVVSSATGSSASMPERLSQDPFATAT